MKASKFPVTYRGEEFRVSVEEGEAFGPVYRVKIYVKNAGLFSGIVPFRKVFSEIYEVIDDEEAVSITAWHAVKKYVNRRDEQRRLREVKALSWKNFSEWDGVITDAENEN